MACKNASSHVTTPCVIFQQKKMVENHLRMGEVPPDTYWNVSDSGGKPGRFLKTGLNTTHSTSSCYMTLDFNCYQIKNHFTTTSKHLNLLLLQVHYLLSTSKHYPRLKPIDKECFTVLKLHRQKACANYTALVTKHEFSHLFYKAWQRSMTHSNVNICCFI